MKYITEQRQLGLKDFFEPISKGFFVFGSLALIIFSMIFLLLNKNSINQLPIGMVLFSLVLVGVYSFCLFCYSFGYRNSIYIYVKNCDDILQIKKDFEKVLTFVKTKFKFSEVEIDKSKDVMNYLYEFRDGTKIYIGNFKNLRFDGLPEDTISPGIGFFITSPKTHTKLQFRRYWLLIVLFVRGLEESDKNENMRL